VAPKLILFSHSSSDVSLFTGTGKLVGNGSQLILDFDIEVGGLVSFSYSATGSGAIGLVFSEPKNWVGE
jgi:hypothetical protein